MRSTHRRDDARCRELPADIETRLLRWLSLSTHS